MIFKFAGGSLDGKLVVGESEKDKEARGTMRLLTTGGSGNDFTPHPTTPSNCSPRNNFERRSRIASSNTLTRWWTDLTTVTC